MAEKILTCRKCHKMFVAKEEEKGITWVERSRGYNYHMSCWNEHLDRDAEHGDADWLDLIFDLISRELHADYDYFKIKAQAENFVNKGGYSMKGVYWTLYWFFIVNKGEYKKEYGIGIMPHVHERACEYWLEQESKKKGILDELLKIQRIEAENGRTIQVNNRRKVKQRSAEPTID